MKISKEKLLVATSPWTLDKKKKNPVRLDKIKKNLFAIFSLDRFIYFHNKALLVGCSRVISLV